MGIILGPDFLENLNRFFIDVHLFLFIRGVIPVQDHADEHVGDDKHADYYEADKINRGQLPGTAILGPILFDLQMVQLVVCALKEDGSLPFAVPHDLVPSFARCHAEQGQQSVPEVLKVSMPRQRLLQLDLRKHIYS